MSQEEISDMKKCPNCNLDTLAHGDVIEVVDDTFFNRKLMKVKSFHCFACRWMVDYRVKRKVW